MPCTERSVALTRPDASLLFPCLSRYLLYSGTLFTVMAVALALFSHLIVTFKNTAGAFTFIGLALLGVLFFLAFLIARRHYKKTSLKDTSTPLSHIQQFHEILNKLDVEQSAKGKKQDRFYDTTQTLPSGHSPVSTVINFDTEENQFHFALTGSVDAASLEFLERTLAPDEDLLCTLSAINNEREKRTPLHYGLGNNCLGDEAARVLMRWLEVFKQRDACSKWRLFGQDNSGKNILHKTVENSQMTAEIKLDMVELLLALLPALLPHSCAGTDLQGLSEYRLDYGCLPTCESWRFRETPSSKVEDLNTRDAAGNPIPNLSCHCTCGRGTRPSSDEEAGQVVGASEGIPRNSSCTSQEPPLARPLDFNEACKRVQKLGLRSYMEWEAYCSSPVLAEKLLDDGISLTPEEDYGAEWKGYSHWLTSHRGIKRKYNSCGHFKATDMPTKGGCQKCKVGKALGGMTGMEAAWRAGRKGSQNARAAFNWRRVKLACGVSSSRGTLAHGVLREDLIKRLPHHQCLSKRKEGGTQGGRDKANLRKMNTSVKKRRGSSFVAEIKSRDTICKTCDAVRSAYQKADDKQRQALQQMESLRRLCIDAGIYGRMHTDQFPTRASHQAKPVVELQWLKQLEDEDGRTPLHSAVAAKCHPLLIEKLCEAMAARCGTKQDWHARTRKAVPWMTRRDTSNLTPMDAGLKAKAGAPVLKLLRKFAQLENSAPDRTPDRATHRSLVATGRATEDVGGDGDCFFRVLAKRLDEYGKDPENHLDARLKTVAHMREHADLFEPYAARRTSMVPDGTFNGTFDSYCDKMAHAGEWITGGVEIFAAAEAHNACIYVFDEANDVCIDLKVHGSDRSTKFVEMFRAENHYTALEPAAPRHITDATSRCRETRGGRGQACHPPTPTPDAQWCCWCHGIKAMHLGQYDKYLDQDHAQEHDQDQAATARREASEGPAPSDSGTSSLYSRHSNANNPTDSGSTSTSHTSYHEDTLTDCATGGVHARNICAAPRMEIEL